MSTFTIDPDNNSTALVEVPADADRATTFSTDFLAYRCRIDAARSSCLFE